LDLDAAFYTGYSAAIVMLAITSYIDLRTREIDPKLWLPFLAFGVALAAYRSLEDPGSFAIYLGLSMVAPAILLILSLSGMMGLADPIALALVALLIPEPPEGLFLPPSMVVLALSSMLMVALLIAPLSILNLANHGEIRKACRSLYTSILVHMTGFPISIKRFSNTKFLYPLIYPKLEGSSIVWICRGSFNIDENPRSYREEITSLVERGLLSGGERIYVTWGVPYILFIFIGVALYPLASQLVEGLFRTLAHIVSPT